MKKFMIFLLMAFLYLGTSQASNEFTPSTSDVGKSLHHWVSPSVGSSAYAKFKPFSSLASDFESAELTDSVVRVHLVGPTHACPGQVITLTAVVENDYLGIESYAFRRNGNYLTTGVDPLYPNRISVTVPDLGGLDSLIQEYDVVITKGCHTFRSPAFYLRVNSIHVQLNDALVCKDSENGMLCADVFSNHAEAPYAYVWYNAETGAVEDTTYVPCKSFSVGKYLVEPHFTWNACVTTSDTAEVKVSNGPADDHITMDDITALACSGSQVSAHLHGIINADSLGTPNISWSLNGITIPGANDSLLLLSPIALAGDTTIYILKAEVSYSGFACKTYSITDTVNFVAQPEISIYGNPIACGDNMTDVELYAIANGYIENPSYTWKINGTTVTYTGTLKDTLKLANVTPTLAASSTPYEITVSVRGENGCSASSAPFALNLNGAPVVHLSRSADTVCNGATVTLTANLADNNIPNLTYEWWYKVGTATTYTKDNTATSAQYTATVTDSTSYKVIVKQTDSECQAADSMSVYVFPATPDVKPLVVSLGDTAICNGDQITLSLIDTANTNQYGVTGTYKWLVNGVEVDDAQGTSISISPSTVASDSTVFTITVNATYATTCATMVASKDTSIVLYKQPTVVISGDPIVCNEDTVKLTANIHGLYGTDKYTWRVDGVDSIMNKDFTAQLEERDYPYNITVVVAPGTACETVSEVYSVLIGNNPTVAIGLSAATVCKDNEVTLTAHLGDYNMPNLTYQWFYKTNGMTDSVAIPTGTSRELTTVVTDTTQYFVTVTQVNSGCTAKGDTTVNVFEAAPDDKPTQLLVDQANVCYGAQVTLTAIDTANYKLFGTGSYQWIVNGVAVANATDSIYTFTPATVDNDSINYTVKVRVEYISACAGIFSEKDTLITVHRNPSVVIAGDAIVCDGSALNLTAVVHDTLAGGNIDYLWRVDGVDSTSGAKFTATLEQRDYPYELTVVLNKGTACEVVSAPFNVLIGNKATAAVEASDTIVCAGSNVTLTAHLGDYNMPNMTYLWYRKPASAAQFDSIPVGTSLSLTTAVAEETEYFVKITQVNSECVAYSDTIKVKVYEKAAAVKPLVLHASDTAVCYGGQIAYAVIDTANINLYGKGTYQWSVNGITLANATDSVFIFSPVAVDNDSTLYDVAVTVTYTTPCEVITASIDTIVNVFSNLSVQISGDPILCQNSTVNLVATVHDTLAGHTVTYLWRVDGVDSVNQNSKTFSAVLPQRDYPYEISVVVGQEGTACGVVSDVYEVLIGINPTVAIEVSAPILCKGEEATLTAHLGDYNMPNLVYQWYYGKPDYSDTNAIAIGTSRTLTVPVEDTTRYYVRVKQVNSECEAWADTVIKVLSPEDPAVQAIELLASDSTVCIGGQIAFTVQDTAIRKLYFGSDTIPGTYTWFVNGFQLMTVSGDHFMFSPAAFDLDSTNYIIEVSASYQTECNPWTATAADTVTAYRNPSVVINGDPMICDTTLVHLKAIVNDTLSGHAVSYLWRVDGVDSTSMNSDIFETFLPARDYPYEITVMINQGSNCEVVSEPFYLYIEDQPQVVITLDYDTVCIGQEVTATAHLGNYNQGNLTYQWFIDGDTVARGTESTFTYTIDKPAGSYTVFSVIVNQLNSACMGTGADTVYTFANPTLDTVLVTNLQDDIYDAFQYHHYYGEPAYDVCEGASIQITAYMKDASGNQYIDTNVTYKWRRNGVVIEGVNGYTFMEQLSILDHDQYKYVYTVEIDEPQYPNCYSVHTLVVTDTVKVRRNPIVIIGGQHYVCYPGPDINNVVLQAWVDGSVDTGAIYRWFRDGQLEDNPYHSMYGAMFTGPFAPRYGFNYVFQVEVVNGSGCSSFSEPFEVTVMAPPVVNITPYTDTVCRGGEVMLVSHLDDYNVLDYELKYQWYANEISTENLIPGATEPFYNTHVDSTTDFIVDVSYLTENVNRPHCFARDTMTVNVYDRPEIDSIIMSLTEVCEGSQVQLTAVMDSVHQGVPNVPYIYEWYRNSELLPGNAATIYDAPMTVDGNEQQYTYSVKVYQNPERMMCESPIFVSSQTLTVFPNPIVAIFGDQHICYTDTITLVANIDTISNPVSTNVHYYWFESGAPIDNLNGDSKTLRYYALAQDEPYRFTVQVERDSSVTGCRSYSYEYDVWVYNAPVANVTIVDTAVCEGAEVTVTAHLNQNVPEQTNLEYQWYTKTASDTDYVLVPGATELTYTTTIFVTTTFKFDVVHTLSGCFDVDSATINVYPIPVVDRVVMSDTNVCEGSDIIVTAILDSTVIGVPDYPYFYEWRRNGELLAGNTATIHDQPMTADGTTQTYVYSVIAYQTPERMACYSELVNSAELTVFGDPRVAIFGDQHVCYTDTISLVANVDTFAYPVGNLHFQWYESGNMITNLNGDSKTLRYYASAQDEPYRFTVQIERDNSEAACRSYSTEYDVWVYNAPVANVTIVDTAVCEGAEVTVTAHLNQNIPEQTNLEYQWYTKTASDTAFVLVPGATELTYTTTIFETTEFQFGVVHTLSGCHDEDSKTIVVYEIPVVTEVVMSDTNVCEGSDVTITAHIDSTKGIAGYPYFYEWRRNGELLAGNTATIHDVPMTADGTTQTYVYSVIAYQTPERMACYSELVNSAELTVFGNPRVAIFGDQHVCYTDTISLVANVDTFAYPVGNLHYIWYESGNMITNLNGDSKTLRYYASAQDEPYRFTVQIERDNSEAACRSYSTEYDVWVYNAPVANVTIVDETVCEGAEVTVTAHLNQNVPEQTNLEYQWFTKTSSDTDYVLVPGATALTYTTIVNDTTEFMFRVVHTLSGCFDTDSKTINVNPIPVVNHVSMSDTNVCEGAQVTIYADIDTTKGVPGMPYFFEWRRNGELLAGNTQTIYDSPMTVDGNEQTFVYSVIAYQDPTRLACFSELVESATLNVFPNPRVAISGDQYVCETDSVFLYANVDTIGRPVGILHYTWYESGRLRDNMAYGLADSRYFSEYFYAQDEPYRFTVEVQRDDIASGCRAYSEEFLVWVYKQPVVNITADETEVCRGGEIVLRANLNNYEFNYANDAQYQWYTVDTVKDERHIGMDADGNYIDSTIVTVVHNPIPGATMLIYRATLDSSAVFGFTATHNLSGCSDYDEIAITVNDIPVIVSVENLSGEDTLCPGGRVELHATVEGGVPGGKVYTWYRNGVQMESTGENLIDYPLAVDNDITMYIYEVVVKQSAAGCESVIDSLSTDTIWVVPNPTIELSGDPIVCDTTNSNIVITANVVSYVDTTDYGYTYQWYENNAPIVGETGLVLSTYKPYRDYPYSFNFEVKNPYGCTVLSEPFFVYVNDNPIVHIAADDTLICENGTVTLTANLYDLNADNMVYVWYKNGDSIPGAYNTTYTTSLDTTATFTFKAFQRNSHCEATSNPVTVTVVAAPSVDSITVVSNDVTICEGHVVTLHANISGGDTTDTPVFTWYKDNEVVEGVTGETFTDYPMSVDNEITSHVYNVTVAQASSACFSLYDVNDEVEITVRPNPRYTIYGDADVCEEADSTIANINLVGITTDNVIGITGDYTFTWYESGVEIAGQDTTTLAINKPYRHEPYLFKLIVTDNEYGCSFETEEFAVTVGQKPFVVIAVDQDSICEGGNVTLTSTLMNQTEEGIIYQWQQDVNGTWNDITGAIAPVYVTPALTETTTFRLHVTNTFNGCEANSISDITVTVKSTPVIDIVNVTAGVVCNGGEVTLTATSADQYTGLGDIQYQWYNNGQAIFGADQNVYTTSPLTVAGDMTTYTFGVQVIMSNSGCVSNIDTATVTVYADPTVTITYDNGLTLCEGGVTTLTANPHHAYFTDFTYQWFLHGQPIPGAINSTYVVENLSASQNAYDYTVEITVNNGTQNGCSAVAEPVYVTIVNNPTATITVNEGVNAICEGGTVTFTVTPNGGVEDTYNPYTYAWYSNIAGNGVVLGTEASFTTSADDAANLYVYYVDVTSDYGCYIRVSDTLRIVADPTVTIAVKMGEDSVVCDGGHTTLIATVEGGLGTASYQWYKNGFAIAGATGNELVTDALYVNETAAYTVSVTQSGIACTATSTQFNVTVYEAIEVALSASSEVNCVGGSVTLTATTTNGIPGDMLTYQWFRNGNPINGANGDQYVTDDNLVAGHYEYQVEVSSTISGCHVAQSGTIGITVEAEPTVMISSDVIGNAICEGGNITLIANVIYATNATQHNNTYTYTWKWYEGTTLMSVQTTDPHYTLPATMTPGSYNFFVEISSNDGLGCDASSQSNLFNVVIKPVPTVILTANAGESCQGGEVTFNAVVIPSNLSGIFYWNVNGTQIITSNASITVDNMAVGTNNVSVVFAPNDAQVACNSATTTITHVVNAIPVVTVAATDPSRLSMCVGGTITVAATATGTANSSDRYVWTVDGQTQTGNTGSTFTTQLNTPGIHTFSAMVERAMGCNSEFSTPIAVTVAEQPTAQLTQTAGFTEMCAGGEITLMAKVPNYATVNNGVTNNTVHGTYTYTWFRDNAEFLTTPNVTVDNAQVTETLNVPAAYTYSVTISASGYNCQAAYATLDHQIRVVPDPSWSVNQVNPTELCIGGIVTLNAEVTGGVENQQAGRIQWYKTFNGVESEVAGLGGQNTDVPEAAGVYTYAPKYIDYIGAGCNIADATPTQVTVNDLPTARFTAGHGSVICGHDYQSFATLEITLTGTAPFTFTIMNMTTGESQTIVTSLSVYTYNVNPAVTSIYRIISVSDANGCIGTMDNVSDAVVSVSDVQIAAETVVASCEDWIARISLQVNASTSTTFTATLPDGSQQTGNIMFDAYTQQHYVEVQMPAVAGDYIVTIEVDGCSGEVLVRVPASDASMGVTSTLVDQRWDDVVVVNNNPDNNGGYRFSTYQWYKNGEPINGATGQYYQEVGGLEGFYSVELDGIRVSDGAHVHFITCEKYFSAGSSIRVYPVPANTTQEVTIELNMTEEELEGAILDIYDVRGAHVKSLNNLTPITKVGNFGAQGTYFGRIITGTNEIKTVKFIIVK